MVLIMNIIFTSIGITIIFVTILMIMNTITNIIATITTSIVLLIVTRFQQGRLALCGSFFSWSLSVK